MFMFNTQFRPTSFQGFKLSFLQEHQSGFQGWSEKEVREKVQDSRDEATHGGHCVSNKSHSHFPVSPSLHLLHFKRTTTGSAFKVQLDLILYSAAQSQPPFCWTQKPISVRLVAAAFRCNDPQEYCASGKKR